MLQALKTGKLPQTSNVPAIVDDSDEYDLLIVGGGATGSGVAVDAASRGLKIALVERSDFSSGELLCSGLSCTGVDWYSSPHNVCRPANGKQPAGSSPLYLQAQDTLEED